MQTKSDDVLNKGVTGEVACYGVAAFRSCSVPSSTPMQLRMVFSDSTMRPKNEK